MAFLLSSLKSVAIAGAMSLSFVSGAIAAPEKDFTVAQNTPTTLPGDLLPDADIVTVADSIDDFSTLVAAIEAAGLDDELMGDGPFTVFAPTNEAFADFDDLLDSRYGLGVSDLLEPANLDLLREVLAYHVVPGAALTSGDIPNGVTMLEAADGSMIQVNRGGDDINVQSVPVTAFDVPASNGVIHVVDDVLLPPDVIAQLEENRAVAETVPAESTTTTTTPPATTTTAPATTAPTTTEAAPAEPVRGLW
ncbi:MAG: fasciclin domain-containing protein [Leptolyngbyaceae cyanobacterium]